MICAQMSPRVTSPIRPSFCRPAGDRDKDGVLDPDDLCPDVPKGEKPDPAKLGCPAGDRDKDHVVITKTHARISPVRQTKIRRRTAAPVRP